MKLAISVIESAFRLHSDSAILSAVSVMIFVNFGSTNNLFPFRTSGRAIDAIFVFSVSKLQCGGGPVRAVVCE